MEKAYQIIKSVPQGQCRRSNRNKMIHLLQLFSVVSKTKTLSNRNESWKFMTEMLNSLFSIIWLFVSQNLWKLGLLCYSFYICIYVCLCLPKCICIGVYKAHTDAPGPPIVMAFSPLLHSHIYIHEKLPTHLEVQIQIMLKIC